VSLAPGTMLGPYEIVAPVAALNHPEFCTLRDVGPDYLIMELVDGETLRRRCEV
jgi:hypothetical protein